MAPVNEEPLKNGTEKPTADEPRKPAGGKTVTVTIDGLAGGGEGVGRWEGKAVFVPLTSPGDVARVRILQERRSFARARLVRLITPSTERIDPSCALFGHCGGCQWQHLPYRLQLEAKGKIAADSLRRIGKLEAPAVKAPTPSPLQYGYRHRARLQVAKRGGSVRFGFFQTRSHSVVQVRSCPILHPALNEILPHLQRGAAKVPFFFMKLKEVTIAADYSGKNVLLGFSSRRGNVDPPEKVARYLADAGKEMKISISSQSGAEIRLGPGAQALRTVADAFSQVNLAQNRNLVKTAMALAAPEEGQKVLDLYCGTGNLSLPAAARGAEVLGIDFSAEAIRLAAANASRLGLASARFIEGKAKNADSLASPGKGRWDLVMINPPRRGAKDSLHGVVSMAPGRILMVSCDPATFARDAAFLSGAGYGVAALRLLDLFPQTFHVETVALFEKKHSPPR